MLSTSQNEIPLPVVFLGLAVVILFQNPAGYLIQNNYFTLGILSHQWLVIAGIPLLIGWRHPHLFAKTFPLKAPNKQAFLLTILMTIALAVGINYLTFLSEKILPPPPAIKEFLKKLMDVESLKEGAWRWVLICLSPAFCEEIFFRGFYQNTIGRHWGKIAGLTLSAVCFALIHGIPWYWHLYLILGFYLSWLLYRGGNLWLPILAHLINNSLTFLIHIVEREIPQNGIWTRTDTLVFFIALAVFLLAARRFERLAKTHL